MEPKRTVAGDRYRFNPWLRYRYSKTLLLPPAPVLMNCAARARFIALDGRCTVEKHNSPWNNEGETYPRIKKRSIKKRERERKSERDGGRKRESSAEKGGTTTHGVCTGVPKFSRFSSAAGYISSPPMWYAATPFQPLAVSSVSCKWSTAVGWIPAGKTAQVWGRPPNSSWIVIQSRPVGGWGGRGRKNESKLCAARHVIIGAWEARYRGLLIPRRQFIAGLRVLGAAKAHAARRRRSTYAYVSAT